MPIFVTGTLQRNRVNSSSEKRLILIRWICAIVSSTLQLLQDPVLRCPWTFSSHSDVSSYAMSYMQIELWAIKECLLSRLLLNRTALYEKSLCLSNWLMHQ